MISFLKKRISIRIGYSKKFQTLVVFLCVLIISILIPAVCYAWEQDEHEAINEEAFKKALSLYSDAGKFKNAPLNLKNNYIGPYTNSTTMFGNGHYITGNYNVLLVNQSMEKWIIHGGFSADEPNLYNSVRHFYDPTKADGKNELTDHNNIHGYYDSAISALDWGYTHPDNPFNFRNALLYYKKSMEIPEDGSAPEVIPQSNGNFRDMEYLPSRKADERSYYLGKSLRSLGESMHMISDMAMPAHTRNDSHPNLNLDTIEAYAKPSMVHSAAYLDPQPEVNLNDIPKRNFVSLAKYTNKTFYSNDTIYDKSKGVFPWNGETPYPSPQLSDFNPVVEKNRIIYYKKFPTWTYKSSGTPMVRESLSALIFGKGTWSIGYSVPYYFASDYIDILAPLAIKASYRTIYDFFPTFNFDLKGEDEIVNEAEGKIGVSKKIELNAELIHDVDKDSAWKEEDLRIKYSGPGVLYKQSKNKKTFIANVIFENGNMTKIKTSRSEMNFSAVDGPIMLYVWDNSKKIVKPEGFPDELDISNFIIKSGESVFVNVSAGGREIASSSYLYKEENIELKFDKNIYNGVTSQSVTLSATVKNAPKNANYSWDFGDTQKVKNNLPSTSHAYNKAGNYVVSLELYDKDSKSTKPAAGAKCEVEITDEIINNQKTAGYWKLRDVTSSDLQKMIEYNKGSSECSLTEYDNSITTSNKNLHYNSTVQISHTFDEPPAKIIPGQVLKLNMALGLVKADKLFYYHEAGTLAGFDFVYKGVTGSGGVAWIRYNLGYGQWQSYSNGQWINDQTRAENTVEINIPETKSDTLYITIRVFNGDTFSYDIYYAYEWNNGA